MDNNQEGLVLVMLMMAQRWLATTALLMDGQRTVERQQRQNRYIQILLEICESLSHKMLSVSDCQYIAKTLSRHSYLGSTS